MRDEEARRLARAVRSTCAAVTWRDPSVVPLPWQRDLGSTCDRVAQAALTGQWSRVTLAAPPRHGKTEHVGVGLPIRCYLGALAAGRSFTVLYATAAEGRAAECSGKVRGAIERIYRLTRDPALAPGDIWTRTQWVTRGGLRWTAVGWTGATGGIDADLLVMDDLIGSSQAYRSPATREQIRRVVQEDLLSRRATAAIQMETRRGTEDTTAWLEREFGAVWTSHVWPCHQPDRGYLWPERYGAEWRASMPHLTDSSPIWRSLYQQEPVAEGGTLIPPDWLTATYPEPPDIAARLADRVVVGVDLAATGKTTSDHCAFVVVAVRGAYRDILHVVRRQVGYVEAKQILRDLCATWRPSAVVVERAANGDAVLDDLGAEIPGLRGERAAADKVTRLTPHLGAFAARQIRTPASPQPWVGPWREEHAAFSGTPGEPDDQVDATVWALVAAETGVSVGYADLF
jgi:phage terminase large subunit-like protein